MLIKINFMLNSADLEILNAHKCKISRNSAFSGSDKPRMLFSHNAHKC